MSGGKIGQQIKALFAQAEAKARAYARAEERRCASRGGTVHLTLDRGGRRVVVCRRYVRERRERVDPMSVCVICPAYEGCEYLEHGDFCRCARGENG